MASDLDNLKTRKTAVIAEIAAISTSTAGGKPNVSGPGTNVDHTGYKQSLYDELKELNSLISQLEPFETVTESLL